MPVLFEYMRNDFTGQTAGVTASASNSGTSGSPFSHVVAAGGGTVTYVSLGGGDMGLRVVPGTSESYARFTTGTPTRRAVIRRQITVPSLPAATQTVLRIWAGATQMGSLTLNSSGQWTAFQGTSVGASPVGTAVAGATYWIELAVTGATTAAAADGVIEYRVYAADGTTLIREWSSGATRTQEGLPSIVRHTAVLSTSGWAADDTTSIEALFTDVSGLWIGARPWVDPQATVVVDPPSTAVVHAGLNPVSIPATSYTWRVVAGELTPLAADGADAHLYLDGGITGHTLTLGVIAASATGSSVEQTIDVQVNASTTFVCDGTSWVPASAEVRTLIDAILY